MEVEPIDLIIDTDPGVDDALAIMLAAAQPHVTLRALTVVAGNVGLPQTVQNALKVLDVIGSDAPVFAGSARPLVYRPAEDAARVHGEDGLGDVGWPASRRIEESEPAAQALVRMANERPGQITLAMIGPLTNLALALRLDPQLPGKFKRLLIMGGAVTGRGNVYNPCAEFNIYSDPEAAHVVFTEWPEFDLADWEATVRHGFPISRVEEWAGSGDHRASFYQQITRRVIEYVQRDGESGEMRAADALALASLVRPDIVTTSQKRFVRVETVGSSRGLTWVDWEERLESPANANILMQVNQQQFEALIADCLGCPQDSGNGNPKSG